MTATGKSFEWMLWSPHEILSAASDEFVAEGFRVRLMGSRLEVSFEASGICSPGSARALAEKYVEALKKRLVMSLTPITEAEFLERTTPPFRILTTFPVNREDRSRVASAVREARNELLASADEALRRCYDYRQDAHECMNTLKGEAAYAAYKAMEVLVERFGSEPKAVAALGETLKTAKRVANTERHIPKKGQPQPKASGRSVELANEVIRKYERYLLGRP